MSHGSVGEIGDGQRDGIPRLIKCDFCIAKSNGSAVLRIVSKDCLSNLTCQSR